MNKRRCAKRNLQKLSSSRRKKKAKTRQTSAGSPAPLSTTQLIRRTILALLTMQSPPRSTPS